MAVKILPEEIIYPDTTAIWEKNLEEVATGKKTFEEFYQKQICGLNALISKAKILKITPSLNAVICPNCGKLMVKRKSKNGYFWGCSGFPELNPSRKNGHKKAKKKQVNT